MIRLSAWVIGLAVTAVAAAQAQPVPVPPQALAASKAVTASAISGPTRFLSNDLLEGRATSKPGDVLAVKYLASALESLGLVPAGPDGGWEQKFEVVGLTSHVPEQWSFDAKGGRVSLRFWDDFIAAIGRQAPSVVLADAELVFVGYGITAPEYRWDDFKGTDVRGKVLLILNNDPDWDDALFAGKRRLYYGRWTYKYEEAARHGAAGAIIVHTTPSAGYGWPVVQNSWGGEQYELPNGGEPNIDVKGWTTEAATRKLLQAAGFDLDALVAKARSRDFRPVPLGIKTSLTIASDVGRAQTSNVMGMLRGSDPKLRDEVVVFSAHHDHLGVGKPDATGDRIYNGARDNASGVGMVLAIARGFAALPEPPRRSILFLLVSGEESGLLGSEYFATHPTVPSDRLVADVNFDSGNIFGRSRDVSEVGRGKSDLDPVLDAVAKLQDRVVTDEAFPDRGAFYRSDQFSFAKVGVPSLYFSAGVDFIGRPPAWGREIEDAWRDAHYHQPSDQIDSTWNWDGMVEDARLGFLVGYAVAQADRRPAWRSGDEFENARPAAVH
ncbi:MAG: M28 family peptidase [Acidobacteriia bacterium]|nr:M28 family peptidase [Terriglobia bacterium]